MGMQPVLDFLLRHGYWVLFLNIFAEQLALPLPALPALLAMGALAGLGHFSFALSLLLAVTACLICDQVWYRLGRVRGHSILRLICKISLEPDTCVSNTKSSFARWGAWSLVFAKFIPGLSAVAAPMAGLTRMPASRFLIADFAGSLFWTGTYLTLGYLFRNQLEELALSVGRFGGSMVTLALIGVGAYIGFKFLQRRRFLRDLRVARVTPEEVWAMLESGEEVAIVDLRDPVEVELRGLRLPGATWIGMGDMESRQADIPRDKEVILYCT